MQESEPGLNGILTLLALANGDFPQIESDWLHAADFYRFPVEYADLPPWLPGMTAEGRILIRKTPDKEARCATLCHELVENLIDRFLPHYQSVSHHLARAVESRCGLPVTREEIPIVWLPLMGSVS